MINTDMNLDGQKIVSKKFKHSEYERRSDIFLFLFLRRKVTILVVGLDKAGKTASIRGMLRGTEPPNAEDLDVVSRNVRLNPPVFLLQSLLVSMRDPPLAALKMS